MRPWERVDALSFEQWVLFLAVSFRDRYRAVARAAAREAHEDLPLSRGGRLTVVQVNAGEAVHFIYSATSEAEPTACRSLTLEPPEGLALQDWALLHGEGYLRFVARGVDPAPAGHFVVFPAQGDEHDVVLHEAERLAHEHAAARR